MASFSMAHLLSSETSRHSAIVSTAKVLLQNNKQAPKNSSE